MPAPSFDEYWDLGKAEAVIKRPSLAVRIGDISEIFISAAAAMADRLTGWAAERIAATYVDGAQGDDLTLLASDHWGIARREATKSSAIVTFNRASADATSQSIPIGTVVGTSRDSRGAEIRYLTTSAASWPASTNGTRTATVRAETAGLEANLAATNLITRLISSPPAGGVYTITTSTQPAGGALQESDSELKDRVRKFPSTLRRGTLAALEYGAISATDVGVVKANAVQDNSGLVTVYVSDASGGSSGVDTDVDPDTVNLGTMTSAVAVELLNWACAGALVQVSGGSVQTVNITVTIAVRIGVDVSQLITDISDAIESRVNKLGIGETLYLSDIVSAAKAVDPDNIRDVEVDLPLTDTVPTTAGSLIRAGVVTVN